MALNLGEMYFQLGAKTHGLQKAEREAKKFATNTERQFSRTSRAASRLGLAIGGIITVEAARRTLMLADNYNVLQQRIKTATRVTGDYVHASREIAALSNRNGTALEANVTLFQQLARIAPDIGATTKDILDLTETVGQLGVISGASTSGMRHGLLQFGQGLASGTFRAEELNSVIENIPELANRIAHGMGKTVAEMRKAVLAGEVLSTDIFDSLIKQVPEINEEFENIPLTVGRASVSLKNSFMQFLGQLDDASGITEVVARNLQDAADFFSRDLAGDFRKGLDKDLEMNFGTNVNGISEVFAQISDSIDLWGDLLDDAAMAFDGMGSSADKARAVFDEYPKSAQVVDKALLDVSKSTGKFILDLPINIRMMSRLIKESIDQLMIKTQLLGVKFELTWEYIKQAGSSAANSIKLMWAKSSDAVIGFFADAISEISMLVEGLPVIGDKFVGIADLASDLKAMANSESKVVAAIAAENAASSETIEALKIKIKLAEQFADTGMAASEARKRNAIEERNLAKQAFENESGDRQRLIGVRLMREAEEEARLQAGILATQKQQEKLAEERRKALIEKTNQEKQEKLRTKLQPKIDALANGLSTELELEMRHYAESIEQIRLAEEMKIETLLPYHDLRERLETEHQERLKEITSKYSDERGKIGAIGAFLGIDLVKKTGDLTLKEQGQIFAQQIDQASQHSKEFFQMKRALALATALIEAPKAILSSYAFGAEFGGPVGGAIAAGIAAAATAVQVSAIASAQYQGGKAVGGNVFAGGMYKVNEQGPEMLSVGGEDFLMMGSQSGSVTPNHKLGGKGGANVVVNVYPQAGETAKVSSSRSGDNTQIDVVIEQIEKKIANGIGRGGSVISESIEAQYGLNRVAGSSS